jgi:hypothetical protein
VILTVVLVATNVYSDFSLCKPYMMKRSAVKASPSCEKPLHTHFVETKVYLFRLSFVIRVRGGVGSNVTLSWENKTIFLTRPMSNRRAGSG